MARVSAGEDVMGIAGQIADDDTDGFTLIEGRLLRRRWFKVQGAQEFKGQKKKSNQSPIEPLNF
jgi:hypothetical protein